MAPVSGNRLRKEVEDVAALQLRRRLRCAEDHARKSRRATVKLRSTCANPLFIAPDQHFGASHLTTQIPCRVNGYTNRASAS